MAQYKETNNSIKWKTELPYLNIISFKLPHFPGCLLVFEIVANRIKFYVT